MQPIIKLDYSYLSKKISEKEVRTVNSYIPRILRPSNSILTILLTLTTVFAVYLVWSGFFIQKNPILILWFIIFYSLVMGLPYIKKSIFKKTLQKFKIQKFAESNRLYYVRKHGSHSTFDTGYDEPYDGDVSKQEGLLFNAGVKSTKTNLMGLIGAFVFFDYAFFTNHFTTTKKNSNTEVSHSWVVSRYTLSRKLPHIVIDSKANRFMHIPKLPFLYSKYQKISLEGNFDDYFTLYAPKDYKIDTLSFITPEIIEYIIQDFKHAKIEIIDNYLYVYYAGTSKKVGVENILKKLLQLAAELEDNINAYRDSRLSFTTTGSFDRENISSTGLRLKRNTIIRKVLIIGIPAIIFFLAILLDIPSVIIAIIFALTIIFVYLYIKI